MIVTKQQFKLIITDHDGTLVNDERKLLPQTRETLERLHAQGYLFGLASGRTVADAKTFPSKWGLSFDFDVIIGLGGGEIWDGVHQQLQKGKQLRPSVVKEIVELLAPFDLSISIIYPDGRHLVSKMDQATKESMLRNPNDRYELIEDLSQLWQEDAPKLLCRIDEERMPQLEAYVKAHPSPHYWGFKTRPDIYEFMDPENTKSNGLRKICRLLDISLEEVMAFGDTTNDNDLLACCYGVCMANGSEDTKAFSKDVTRYTNNENGVGDYIERHLLQGK